jgi:phosphatidylglycerophosphate synthase
MYVACEIAYECRSRRSVSEALAFSAEFFFLARFIDNTMFDKVLREWKEKALRSVGLRIGAMGIRPNDITLAAFVVGILCGFAILADFYWCAIGLWWLNRLLDGLDGTVARCTNQQTDFGGYVDIVCDFVVYAWVPTALTIAWPSGGSWSWPLLNYLMSSYFVNAASLFCLAAILEKRSNGSDDKKLTSIAMPTGLIEGSETVALYAIMIAFPSYNHIVFPLFATAVFVNVIQRMGWARVHLTQ